MLGKYNKGTLRKNVGWALILGFGAPPPEHGRSPDRREHTEEKGPSYSFPAKMVMIT